MELMAHDPTQRKIKEPPSFDGFPNAFVTTFQVFIGGWTDVLTMQDDEGPPWKTARSYWTHASERYDHVCERERGGGGLSACLDPRRARTTETATDLVTHVALPTHLRRTCDGARIFGPHLTALAALVLQNTFTVNALQSYGAFRAVDAIRLLCQRVFFILTYSVMTIGLCNLLTNIVVDFNSVSAMTHCYAQQAGRSFSRLQQVYSASGSHPSSLEFPVQGCAGAANEHYLSTEPSWTLSPPRPFSSSPDLAICLTLRSAFNPGAPRGGKGEQRDKVRQKGHKHPTGGGQTQPRNFDDNTESVRRNEPAPASRRSGRIVEESHQQSDPRLQCGTSWLRDEARHVRAAYEPHAFRKARQTLYARVTFCLLRASSRCMLALAQSMAQMMLPRWHHHARALGCRVEG
eukprot:521206-Rhodomonas_salina.4